MITGGCFCGEVRYAIEDGEYPVANCHCSMCRRTSAAPFVTWLVAPEASFNYTKGRPKVLKSSEMGTRYFCANCGTPVACVLTTQPGDIDVRCVVSIIQTISFRNMRRTKTQNLIGFPRRRRKTFIVD